MFKDAPVDKLPQIGSSYALKLNRLGIETISDLFFHIPTRYLDFRNSKKIKEIKVGDIVVINATVKYIKNQFTKSGKFMQIAQVEDESGTLTVVWFNQRFLTRILYPGITVSLAGTVKWFGRTVSLTSPDFEIIKEDKDTIHTKGLVPIYSETSGLNSKWFRNRMHENIDLLESYEEYLPDNVLNEYKLGKINDSLINIHNPKNNTDLGFYIKRLIFEELISFQLASITNKHNFKAYKTYKLKYDEKELSNFYKDLPFNLTSSQKNVVVEILEDISKDQPMNRLLEGDVGSGKTIVALVATFVAFLNGYQTVIMAPTQILAEQHYKTIGKIFSKFKIRLRFVTGKIDKSDIGKTDVFIGTHALIGKKELFNNVALVVIDEQHKFGVNQRQRLLKNVSRNKHMPHLLTMTATPIPRTIALTAYGDMDLSVINELPKGRQEIKTWIVEKGKRDKAYDWIKNEIINNDVQAYVVCPLIEESEIETLKSIKSVKAEFERLEKIMKPLKLGLLHGKMKSEEKEIIIEKFSKGEVDILVSTPVVEVGIDVPNACIMVVEGSERFGLSSLHQLRGRVGRGVKQSYCLLMTDSPSRKPLARLQAMEKNHSGFELAEIDLKLRGPGEIFGVKQHGIPELKIATWQDFDNIRLSKRLSEEIFKNKDLLAKVYRSNHFILAGMPKLV